MQRVEGARDVHNLKHDQPEVLIVRATAGDLEDILRLEQVSFSAPWTRKMILAELEGNPFASFWVARKGPDGEIQAYICYWVVFEELHLMNLAVSPPCRRKGVARALVHHALEDGQRRGARRAILEVRASNTAALSMYRGLGFHQVAVRAGYYVHPVEDAILMELNPISTTHD